MKQILYIEDDHDMCDLVSEIMAYEDYQVLSDCGRSLFNIIRQKRVGLILIEEALSWTRGSKLCLQLKSEEGTKHIPVIMISAQENIDIICRYCSADAFIRKPFEIYDVIDIVNEFYLKG